jgi:hypothetical protein
MKGVVFLGDRKLELREFPDPTPGPRDVILEIKADMVTAIRDMTHGDGAHKTLDASSTPAPRPCARCARGARPASWASAAK